MWFYGQGFPKSHNLGKAVDDEAWAGYGFALKPGYEPIILAMKPLDGSFANNARKWGVAGLNIGGCRIGDDEITINRWKDGCKPFGGGAGHPSQIHAIAGQVSGQCDSGQFRRRNARRTNRDSLGSPSEQPSLRENDRTKAGASASFTARRPVRRNATLGWSISRTTVLTNRTAKPSVFLMKREFSRSRSFTPASSPSR